MSKSPQTPRKYMVAVDGSSHAESAFNYALSHSQPQDQVIIVTAVKKKYPNLSSDMLQNPEKLEEEKNRVRTMNVEQKEKAKNFMDKYMKACSDAGRTCTSHIARYSTPGLGGTGSIGEELCKAAEGAKIDALIVGNRGLTGLSRMMIGSVSDYVVKSCRCNVTVVKGSQ